MKDARFNSGRHWGDCKENQPSSLMNQANECVKSGRESKPSGDDYLISILDEQAAQQLEMTRSVGPKTVILVGGPGIGEGDSQLGSILMNHFFYSLTRLEETVRCVIFVNSGVFLTTEGSNILNYLNFLQDRGVEIISSSTCLEQYHLTDRLKIGTTANMFTITEKLMDSLRVITL